MNRLDKVRYTAKMHTTDGWEGGASPTSDGRLDIRPSTPGAPGSGTNPEQLFAAGWSACFLSAMKIVGGKMRVVLPADLAINASGIPIFAIRRRTAKATC